MTKRLTLAVPGDLATPTGGYAYDRRVTDELRKLDWQIDVHDIGDGFPQPTAAQLAKAHATLAAASPEAPLVIDGLAFGVMDRIAAALAQTHRLVALVHHPLALETGLTADRAAELRASERAALTHVRHAIATSSPTADILIADYGMTRGKITVAPPGNDPMPQAMPSRDGVCRLLAVGALVPRKGYDVLIAALAKLADLPWRLTVVGDPARSPETAADLKSAAIGAGLDAKIVFAGILSDEALSEEYVRSDIFVTASHFEGYGMAVTTAIACGLPIVATAGGALPHTVGDAGLLVPLNDEMALATALQTMMTDKEARARQREASRAAAQKLPAWPDTAARFAAAIEGIA